MGARSSNGLPNKAVICSSLSPCNTMNIKHPFLVAQWMYENLIWDFHAVLASHDLFSTDPQLTELIRRCGFHLYYMFTIMYGVLRCVIKKPLGLLHICCVYYMFVCCNVGTTPIVSKRNIGPAFMEPLLAQHIYWYIHTTTQRFTNHWLFVRDSLGYKMDSVS